MHMRGATVNSMSEGVATGVRSPKSTRQQATRPSKVSKTSESGSPARRLQNEDGACKLQDLEWEDLERAAAAPARPSPTNGRQTRFAQELQPLPQLPMLQACAAQQPPPSLQHTSPHDMQLLHEQQAIWHNSQQHQQPWQQQQQHGQQGIVMTSPGTSMSHLQHCRAPQQQAAAHQQALQQPPLGLQQQCGTQWDAQQQHPMHANWQSVEQQWQHQQQQAKWHHGQQQQQQQQQQQRGQQAMHIAPPGPTVPFSTAQQQATAQQQWMLRQAPQQPPQGLQQQPVQANWQNAMPQGQQWPPQQQPQQQWHQLQPQQHHHPGQLLATHPGRKGHVVGAPSQAAAVAAEASGAAAGHGSLGVFAMASMQESRIVKGMSDMLTRKMRQRLREEHTAQGAAMRLLSQQVTCKGPQRQPQQHRRLLLLAARLLQQGGLQVISSSASWSSGTSVSSITDAVVGAYSMACICERVYTYVVQPLGDVSARFGRLLGEGWAPLMQQLHRDAEQQQQQRAAGQQDNTKSAVRFAAAVLHTTLVCLVDLLGSRRCSHFAQDLQSVPYQGALRAFRQQEQEDLLHLLHAATMLQAVPEPNTEQDAMVHQVLSYAVAAAHAQLQQQCELIMQLIMCKPYIDSLPEGADVKPSGGFIMFADVLHRREQRLMAAATDAADAPNPAGGAEAGAAAGAAAAHVHAAGLVDAVEAQLANAALADFEEPGAGGDGADADIHIGMRHPAVEAALEQIHAQRATRAAALTGANAADVLAALVAKAQAEEGFDEFNEAQLDPATREAVAMVQHWGIHDNTELNELLHQNEQLLHRVQEAEEAAAAAIAAAAAVHPPAAAGVGNMQEPEDLEDSEDSENFNIQEDWAA